MRRRKSAGAVSLPNVRLRADFNTGSSIELKSPLMIALFSQNRRFECLKCDRFPSTGKTATPGQFIPG
jgi:hypothetical protein